MGLHRQFPIVKGPCNEKRDMDDQRPRSLGMGMVFYENAMDPDLKALGLFCSFTTKTADTKTIHTHTYKAQSL